MHAVWEDPIHHVGIGEAVVANQGEILEANLGSCLGIALFWKRRGLFALAHCLLPVRTNKNDHRWARYADTAVLHLVRRMGVPSHATRDLVAVIGGGANVYGNRSVSNIGPRNIAAGVQALRDAHIEIVGRQVGAHETRTIRIEPEAGQIFISQTSGSHRQTAWQM